MCWRLTWPCVPAGDVRLWRSRRGPQNAAAADRRIPPVLPRRLGVGCVVDGGVAAAADRRSGITERLRPAELAHPRNAVRLRDGHGWRVSADRDPELDQPRSGGGNTAG